jgi:CRP/FNR family transcriptional regulator, cyclic AMP receptor protein
MNRFRKLGLIEYNGRIRVHKSLLNVVLHDQFTEPHFCRQRLTNAHAREKTFPGRWLVSI